MRARLIVGFVERIARRRCKTQPRVNEKCTYLRKTGLFGVKSSLSKSSPSSSELRRDPGMDLDGRKPLPWDDGGEAICEPDRLPRGVLIPGVMLDMLNRLGRDSAVGKPLLSLYSGGVVGWLCLPYLMSEERRVISSSSRRDCKSMSSISASKRRRCSFRYSYSSFFFSS